VTHREGIRDITGLKVRLPYCTIARFTVSAASTAPKVARTRTGTTATATRRRANGSGRSRSGTPPAEGDSGSAVCIAAVGAQTWRLEALVDSEGAPVPRERKSKETLFF